MNGRVMAFGGRTQVGERTQAEVRQVHAGGGRVLPGLEERPPEAEIQHHGWRESLGVIHGAQALDAVRGVPQGRG